VVVGSLNDWQKERQFKVLNEKKEERGVKVIRNGVEHLIDVKVCWFLLLIQALSHYLRCAFRYVSQEIVVGDVALLEPGEIVPCDGIFLSGHNVKCDESAATGESDAIKKASYTDCLALKSLNDVHTEGGALGGEQRSKAQHVSTHTDCFVVSGSKVLEGVGSYVVVAVGTKSFNGRIMMGAIVSFIFSVANNNSTSSSDGRGEHSASTEAQHPRRINREDRKYRRHYFVFVVDD